MYDAIFIEDRKKPTVTLANENFLNDAMSAASSKGMPVVRLVPEPIVSESTDVEFIEKAVTAAMDSIISSLTRPLTAEEKAPRPRDVENPARIVFKGNIQEVNRFFYRRGWTDGLPVIPPTEELVAEMLTGTDLAPDHLVCELEPRLGKATVERIAINAVMAGALPTYLPLLIAATEALNNPRAGMMAASTGSWAPFWVVNGPVRNDIGVNCSYGAMSPGNIANATIGRTMGLITKNIRGIRQRIEDMGNLGNPGKYSMVAGENEEASPWEPLHVEHGFKKEDSTITVSFPQTYIQLVPYGTDYKGVLNSIIYNIPPIRMGTFGVILSQPNAVALASKGWTKQNVKDFVIENARAPWERHSNFWASETEAADKRHPFNPGDSYALFHASPSNPEPVKIYVFGGIGSWMGLVGGGPPPVTKKAVLPAKWDKLVAKYKDVVPNYIRY